MKRLEKKISQLEEKRAEITAAFDDASLSAERITTLSKELSNVGDEVAELEMKWMELAELE